MNFIERDDAVKSLLQGGAELVHVKAVMRDWLYARDIAFGENPRSGKWVAQKHGFKIAEALTFHELLKILLEDHVSHAP
jgi:hypothetical protein